MSIFSINLKKLRAEKGLSQQELAEIIGMSKSSINMYERGEREPGIETIQRLAHFFNVSVDRLFYDMEKTADGNYKYYYDSKDDSATDNKTGSSICVRSISTDNIFQIPVYESVSAGFGAYADDRVIDYIPVSLSCPTQANDTIAVIVKGDSMSPKIEEGDKIIVHKQTSVDSGDIAVVLLDGEEALVKKVKYGKTWIELHSVNPYYPVRKFEGEDVLRLQILGKVVGSYRSF